MRGDDNIDAGGGARGSSAPCAPAGIVEHGTEKLRWAARCGIITPAATQRGGCWVPAVQYTSTLLLRETVPLSGTEPVVVPECRPLFDHRFSHHLRLGGAGWAAGVHGPGVGGASHSPSML
jgi:hypothetical protein